MSFDDYMHERCDLMQFLLSIKITAALGDSDGVVEIVNRAFLEHLEYLEGADGLATEFYVNVH